MDSETIRTTISPIFIFCGASLAVGILIGIILSLLEETLIIIFTWLAIGAGIAFFFWFEYVYLRRKIDR